MRKISGAQKKKSCKGNFLFLPLWPICNISGFSVCISELKNEDCTIFPNWYTNIHASQVYSSQAMPCCIPICNFYFWSCCMHYKNNNYAKNGCCRYILSHTFLWRSLRLLWETEKASKEKETRLAYFSCAPDRRKSVNLQQEENLLYRRKSGPGDLQSFNYRGIFLL